MNIIVIGCGKIGETLAEQLNNEGHKITIVDKNEKLVNSLAMRLDVIGVSGNGAILDVQKEAGIEKADLLIATTGSDELNMLICLIAKKEGHCETIARIRNMEYEEEIEYLRNEMGLSMVINPERLCAHEIVRLLRYPSAEEIEVFSGGRAEMIKMVVSENSPLIGMLLKDLPKVNANVLVCMIERGQEVLIPSGNTAFEKGDRISFIARPMDAMAFMKSCNKAFRSSHSAFIVGGGRITHYICAARHSSRRPIDLKVVDNNIAACNSLSEKYPEVTVIHADGTDQSVLREEGVENAEVFMPLTGLDEQNVMLSLIAAETTKARCITKVNHMTPENIPSSIDIGALICPKNITANSVVRFARARENSANSSITSLYKLARGRAEAQEYRVIDEPRLFDKEIRDLKIKNNVLIAAIIRDNKLVRPTGSDRILPDDHIIVVALSELNIRQLSDILV